MRDQFNASRGFNEDGSRRVGNLDVTFDPSVSREQRQAFLRDPLRPTAAIERFKNRRPVQVFSNRSAQHDYGKKAPTGPEFLTKESAPHLGWKECRAINQEIGANYRERLKATTGIQQTKLTDEGAMARASLIDRGQTERSMMANETAQEQNAIRESEVMSQNRIRDIQGQQGQLDLDRQDRINQFQQEYLDAGTDPERKEILRQQLAFLQGREPARPTFRTIREQTGDLGETTERLLRVNPDGSAEYVAPQYTSEELARYQQVFQSMNDEEKEEYVKSLKLWNPTLFHALKASHGQKRGV